MSTPEEPIPPHMVGKCDVCGREDQGLWVYALAGAPVTVATCRMCLELGAYPYGILVGKGIGSGYPEEAADWFKETVINSLAVCNKTIFDYVKDLAEAQEEYDRVQAEEDFGELASDEQ